MTTVTCTVYGERAELFRAIFGTDTVPIVSPIPELGNFPDIGQQQIYKLDLLKIDSEQRERLVLYLSIQTNGSRQKTEFDLNTFGMPILADNTLVEVPLEVMLDTTTSDIEIMYWDWYPEVSEIFNDETGNDDIHRR